MYCVLLDIIRYSDFLWWMTNPKRRTMTFLWAVKLYHVVKCIVEDTDASRAVEEDIITEEENENS